MVTKVSVAIPWRPTEDRQWGYEQVCSWYDAHGFDVTPVDSDDTMFNLAAARNRGVAALALTGADVVILNDADTIPEIGPLRAAVSAAEALTAVVLPYGQYRSLRAPGTIQARLGTPLEDCHYLEVEGAVSGVLVATPRAWWAVGSQDERFRGWGFEDAAFAMAYGTLLGEPMPRVRQGRVYAFHHESQVKEGPQYSANAQLCYRYGNAQGDPVAMSALVAEWRWQPPGGA